MDATRRRQSLVTGLLAAGMVLPGLVSACCVLADRTQRSVTGLIAMLVMTLAMAGMFVAALGNAILWGAALVAAGMAEAVETRIQTARGRRAGRVSEHEHRTHRPLTVVLMGGLVLLSAAGHGSSDTADGHHGHGVAVPAGVLAVVLTIMLAGGLVWRLIARREGSSAWSTIETWSMLVMTLSMAVSMEMPAAADSSFDPSRL